MKINKILGYFLGLLLVILPFAYSVHAVEIQPPNQNDINVFNKILEPVMKVYNFVKYSASVLALLFLIFAAISMFTNDNPMEKDKAKSKMMYIVVGLIVIWIAPIAVNYLTV
ncbi:hypothetical protein HYU23_04780 [Candidatus Woesearchaeota archaeon]|nr:hypothetical protein [Candidatus Woesearchaeota archaeon]